MSAYVIFLRNNIKHIANLTLMIVADGILFLYYFLLFRENKTTSDDSHKMTSLICFEYKIIKMSSAAALISALRASS